MIKKQALVIQARIVGACLLIFILIINKNLEMSINLGRASHVCFWDYRCMIPR